MSELIPNIETLVSLQCLTILEAFNIRHHKVTKTNRLIRCSQVFFDRTAIRSLRPQVLEIFAHAIGDVVSLQSNLL